MKKYAPTEGKMRTMMGQKKCANNNLRPMLPPPPNPKEDKGV
jgi:hypothetical protein